MINITDEAISAFTKEIQKKKIKALNYELL